MTSAASQFGRTAHEAARRPGSSYAATPGLLMGIGSDPDDHLVGCIVDHAEHDRRSQSVRWWNGGLR